MNCKNSGFTYGTAQFKLDICMCVLVELLKKFCKVLMSSTWAMYVRIMLLAVYHTSDTMRVVCPLSHALPSLNPAHAQYMKYRCPNHSNHGQQMYLM